LLVAIAVLGGCSDGSECGASEGVVQRIIDGDTIALEDGRTIRYLMVNTPETTGGSDDCFGAQAVAFNRDLVEGKTVQLRYDVECEDRFDRTLAYVSVAGQEVNKLMLQRGYACLLHIPPNGDDRVEEYEALEDEAKADNRGLWGACSPIPCN
jgi:micrococcal nuclease